MVLLGALGIEGQGELVGPAELETGLGERVVPDLGGGMALREVGGVRGDLVGDDALADVVLVRQAEVLLGRDVAEHRGAIPADHRGADGGGDVVVPRGNVGGEGSERVERGLVAPLQLLVHVLLDHVHGHVAGAFVHDLHAAFPGAGGQLALRLQFGELRLVVGVGDRTGPEAVADREADVVGGHDVADVVPVGVEKILFVMRETPFGHDAAAARDDAGHAVRGERHEAQQHAGVNGEVIHALLGLLDEGVAEEFPGKYLGLAVHFFERLINGHGADGHGRVAEDPFTGGVDVLAGGEVHDGVGTPLGGPAHLFDLFLDAGGDGAVADVGVDFDEEVPADDHRLELGVVDVCGDDGAAGGDFAADELGGDFGRDALGEAAEDAGRVVGLDLGGADVLLVEVVADDVLLQLGDLGAAHVFANRDELHLGGDDASAGVGELGDDFAGLRLQGIALGVDGGLQGAEEAFALRGGVFGVVGGEVAVVAGLDGAAGVFFDVVAGEDPVLAQGGQAFFDGALVGGIAPRAGGVIDAHGVIDLDAAIEALRGAQSNLAHGDADILVDLPLDIDAGGGGELLGGMGLEGGLGIGDHGGMVLGSRFSVE